MLNAELQPSALPHPTLAATGRKPPQAARPQQLYLTPGQTIGVEAEPAALLYRVTQGCIALYHMLDDGRRQIIDILGPERCFRAADPAMTARALTYTKVDVIDPAAAPQLSADSAIKALARIHRHAMLLGRMTAAEKVASALLDLAGQFPRKSRGGRPGKPSLTLYLTRADLADWLGLTIETVSRTLNQFKRDGLIDFTHAEVVTISRPDALGTLASGGTVTPTRPARRTREAVQPA